MNWGALNYIISGLTVAQSNWKIMRTSLLLKCKIVFFFEVIVMISVTLFYKSFYGTLEDFSKAGNFSKK